MHAGMAELVDAHDSKSCGAIHGSSILPPGTMKSKVVVVCGPTATGKTDFSVDLAKKIDGEVISADSRQVYKGMDLGTGKVTKKEMQKIPHHLLDVVSPKKIFTVSEFQRLGTIAIEDILKRGKTPIVCGGTGFYIDALIYQNALPDIQPDRKLREKLIKLSPEKLAVMLEKLDARRAKEIDPRNKIRMIRAIEIAKALGKVPKINKPVSPYDVEWIGLDAEDDVLKARIEKRLLARIKKGMIKEVKTLHAQGVTWKRMDAFGLEYRFIAHHLQGKLSKNEMIEKLKTAIWQYAKRQRTWFKRNKNIKWLNVK
jgi:tRNA dimethylallyltransferase